MGTYVITVARGFGSGGKNIAIAAGKKLGIPVYYSQIAKMASEWSGLSESLFNKTDEKLRGGLFSKLKSMPSDDHICSPADSKFTSDDNLFKIQAHVIKELAENESCIIIGKCANHILRHNKNTASVYIEAPRRHCLAVIMDEFGCSEEEAALMIKKTDKYRADYYHYYTSGKVWTDPVAYDITLNSGRLSDEQCTDMIIDLIKRKNFI
ncbi:MAG: cytidylate kinase-like family protein [Ruminococcus sp.]|jgi:cytidylate kinase|nr:cytidylate kinase-like family protein [Ruminococcus sp.]